MPEAVVRFARRLRSSGLDVPPDCVVRYAQALDAVGLTDRNAVYWAGRATLVRRPEDGPIYDAVFAECWEGRVATAGGPEVVTHHAVGIDGERDGAGGEGDGEADQVVRWSATEVLRHRDLAWCTPEEQAETDRLVDAIRLAGPRRRSRRMRPTHRERGRLDVRRTVAAALRAGGETVTLEYLAPGHRRRPVVLLLDVSGSMAPYARALLRFAHAAVASRAPVEVFALGTRLTRLTPALTTHDADAALAAAMGTIPDFEGGTRLGATVGEFADRWGVRGMARGAVVVVLSDGWDRGDPALLGEHVARLSRVANRLVWVNPLKASPGFVPTAGGMAAAMPWIDELVEGHAVASLEVLAHLLHESSSPSARPVGAAA